MNKDERLTDIERAGIIPAVRVGSADDARFASETVFHAGIPVIEITMTTPGALEVIADLTRSFPEASVGAGSIADVKMAEQCLDAGANFLTTTGLDIDILRFALANEAAIIPGALTPSEIIWARKAGADFVKVFPCSCMGGPAYIRALRAPLPHVRLIASGGVGQQNAAEFIRAGANVIGVGQELLPRTAIRVRNADWIGELVRRFTAMVKEGRASGSA